MHSHPLRGVLSRAELQPGTSILLRLRVKSPKLIRLLAEESDHNWTIKKDN